ncbi:MAG: TRAP transporter permease [Gemmatimonadales bacterium]
MFHLYAAGVSPFTALVQRPVHWALMAVLAYLGVGVRRRSAGKISLVVAAASIGAAIAAGAYMVAVHHQLVARAGASTPLDLVMGALAVVVTLELARRTSGWGLVSVALLAITYAFAGPYLPGLLAHGGYGARRLIEHLYLSTEGIWGVPLGVSADFVYLFVLFGAVLDAGGGGKLLIALSSKIAGSSVGGPAKTASVASALMGSLSGSAVANVVTTGTLTIPVMKRTGFKPHFAAAIEAAASTGGQLMPPVMGAGAFILATWTNIPYTRVAVAAAIPAVLYYVALFMAIHLRARKMNVAVTPTEADATLSRIHLLLPLAVIVLFLGLGRSPMRAAFWGVVTAAAMTLIAKSTRLDWPKARGALVAAASGTVQVAAACAAAGIVVGVASLTGIGLRMSQVIVTLSGGHLPIALLLTAIGSVLLGMGLPTTAAYVVLAALGAPALTQLGVPLLAAHLFIFYYGALSNITPPVALAAYSAAGIADAPPLKTASAAVALAAAGFVVPFAFVYGPPLLLDGSLLQVLGATVTAALGVTALAAATIGYGRRTLVAWERAVLLAAGVALMLPDLVSNVVAGSVGSIILVRKS